jgi:hypothetical protein
LFSTAANPSGLSDLNICFNGGIRLPSLEVSYEAFSDSYVLKDITHSQIATSTQEVTHLFGGMTMVYVRAGHVATADSTAVFLGFAFPIKFIEGDVIFLQQIHPLYKEGVGGFPRFILATFVLDFSGWVFEHTISFRVPHL